MELFLDNVGIIKNTSVKIDGLTVITGKNNAGKTTVGKVMFSLIRSVGNAEKEHENDKRDYIIEQLDKITVLLLKNGMLRDFFNEAAIVKDNTESYLDILDNSLYYNFPIKKLISLLLETEQNLPQLTINDYQNFISRNYTFINTRKKINKVDTKQFNKYKETALDICRQTLRTIKEDKTFEHFVNDRIKAYLNKEFSGQVNPVRKPGIVAYMCIKEAEHSFLQVKVKNNLIFESENQALVGFPYKYTFFIDDPAVLDHISDGNLDVFTDGGQLFLRKNSVLSHRGHLAATLSECGHQNFFVKLDLQNRYQPVLDKINFIVPGTYQKTKDGDFYILEKAQLKVQNLAAGSKLFFVLKMLLTNGKLNDETVLILDEPEAHLHPEWINKFAEILVLLIKELKLCVLLTTHSPNLLLALEYYSKTYSIFDNAHFYLTQPVNKNSWAATLECIDDDINKGYAHLSIPLIEMSLRQKSVREKEY